MEQEPDYATTIRIKLAACAHLGRLDEARNLLGCLNFYLV